MLELLSYLVTSLAAVSLVVLLGIGVLPRLAHEKTLVSPAPASWLDLWIPILASLPAIFVVTLSGPAVREPFAAWHAVAVPVGVGSIGLGLALCWPATRVRGRQLSAQETAGQQPAVLQPVLPGLGGRHGLILIPGGVVLVLLAAFADRVSIWQGQVMITAAIIWIWMCSPGPARSDRRGSSDNENPRSLWRLLPGWSGQGTKQSVPPVSTIATPARGAVSTWARDGGPSPRLVLHWAGRLAHPMPVRLKLGLLAVVAISALALVAGQPRQLWILTSIVGCSQLAVVLWTAYILGGSAAQRVAASIMVLSIMLGLGGMAVSLTWANGLGAWFDSQSTLTTPTQLVGLSSIRAAAILLTGLGLLAVVASRALDGRSISVGMILIVTGAVVLMAGSEPMLERMAEAIVEVLLRLSPPDDPQSARGGLVPGLILFRVIPPARIVHSLNRR